MIGAKRNRLSSVKGILKLNETCFVEDEVGVDSMLMRAQWCQDQAVVKVPKLVLMQFLWP